MPFLSKTTAAKWISNPTGKTQKALYVLYGYMSSIKYARLSYFHRPPLALVCSVSLVAVLLASPAGCQHIQPSPQFIPLPGPLQGSAGEAVSWSNSALWVFGGAGLVWLAAVIRRRLRQGDEYMGIDREDLALLRTARDAIRLFMSKRGPWAP
jgi:hypothetical protein